MKMKVFTIYDVKAEAYLRPLFTTASGLAIRSVIAAMEDPRHDLSKYPADYTLFEIAEWDDLKGEFKMYDAKINHGCLIEFVKYTQVPSNNNHDIPKVAELPQKTEGVQDANH